MNIIAVYLLWYWRYSVKVVKRDFSIFTVKIECDGFHFGKNCENPCNCGIGSSRCDKEKGCVCKTGWTGAKCDLDIDECAATNPCTGGNQVCQNSPGAYKCICENGYKDSSGACTGMFWLSCPLQINETLTNTIYLADEWIN